MVDPARRRRMSLRHSPEAQHTTPRRGLATGSGGSLPRCRHPRRAHRIPSRAPRRQPPQPFPQAVARDHRPAGNRQDNPYRHQQPRRPGGGDRRALPPALADRTVPRSSRGQAFKWIKQNLKIKRFLGTSKNAVAIQIFTALIAYLILRAAHQTQDAITNCLAFTRLVRLNLMHKRSIRSLGKPQPPPPADNRQLTLTLNAA